MVLGYDSNGENEALSTVVIGRGSSSRLEGDRDGM
jgi:hypothetical protein